MTELPDADVRERIESDIAATLFVDAGAGSGKTTALVGRYRSLVLDGGVPARHIAAVTFTEKAGAELRDRLRETFERDVANAEPCGADGADGPGGGDSGARDDSGARGGCGARGNRARRAAEALNELDGAAIGTLHSFARRILLEHPIEAGIPPGFEVSDEIGSSVAFDEVWQKIEAELLDDEAAAPMLSAALTLGVRLTNMRDVAWQWNRNWDLLDDDARLAADQGRRVSAHRWRELAAQAEDVAAYGAQCRDQSDRLCCFVERIGRAATALRGSEGNTDAVIAALGSVESKALNRCGNKANWPDIETVRQARRVFVEAVQDEYARIVDVVLRGLAGYLGARIAAVARDRVRTGLLEYHDLLVAARELVRTDADVRAALHAKYRRLLLDEFQDTDPIQIDLAARISAGDTGGADDWRDVPIPDGRLFVVGDPKQSIYRFRRADIATYLAAADELGERLTLSTSFRTTAPVLSWINSVFSGLIAFVDGVQPEYVPVHAARDEQPAGPPVAIVGGPELDPDCRADDLRAAEAGDIAAAIAEAVGPASAGSAGTAPAGSDTGADPARQDAAAWQVRDRATGRHRPARYDDVAVLLPTRTSLDELEEALDAAGIPYHAEASSLVYATPAVRDLLMCARAVANPVDELALVTTLRSPLFGCGDDDLWRWRSGGGRFRMFMPVADHPEADGPVGVALEQLAGLAAQARWMSPAELLLAIIHDRRILEVAAGSDRHVEQWRRLRFVVDQARGFSDVSDGGVRDYLDWVAMQAEGNRRVTESVTGELGLNSVHILTVHAAKGLEYPIVALSGMSGTPRSPGGVRLGWPDGGGYELSISKDLATSGFDDYACGEKERAAAERARLLYVAATRARDHLIVALHRKQPKDANKPGSAGDANRTAAELLAAYGARAHGAVELVVEPRTADTARSGDWAAPEPFEAWRTVAEQAREASRRAVSVSASSLDGTVGRGTTTDRAETETEPDATVGGDPAATAERARAAEPRADAEADASGIGGRSVGSAVHAVLQVVDLADPGDMTGVVRAQAVAHGVEGYERTVAAMARAGLESDLVRRAAAGEYWRETFVGANGFDADGGESVGAPVLEGFIDLVVRTGDGRLMIVDYKTDAVADGGYAAKDAFYRPQIEAYAKALHAATGTRPSAYLLYLQPEGAVCRQVIA